MHGSFCLQHTLSQRTYTIAAQSGLERSEWARAIETVIRNTHTDGGNADPVLEDGKQEKDKRP